MMHENGKTYVAVGMVDNSQLLFGQFEEWKGNEEKPDAKEGEDGLNENEIKVEVDGENEAEGKEEEDEDSKPRA